MTMCHSSFLAAAWKMYNLPPDWFYDLTVFRLVLGIGMIALHLWTAASIYDSLGEFGWFCGDFFFDPPPKNLTYSGIYRFLNSPERVLGMAGIWGVAVITWTAPIFYLATTAQVLNLAFLHFVERPHMNKVCNHEVNERAEALTTSPSCTVRSSAKRLVLARLFARPSLAPSATGSLLLMTTSTLRSSSSRRFSKAQSPSLRPASVHLSRTRLLCLSLTQPASRSPASHPTSLATIPSSTSLKSKVHFLHQLLSIRRTGAVKANWRGHPQHAQVNSRHWLWSMAHQSRFIGRHP